MANLPISGLTAGAAVSNTDLFPDVQTVGVGPVKVTGLQIKTYCSLNPTLVNPQVNNILTVGQQGLFQGSIVLGNTSGAFPTTIASSNSATASWTLTLPTSAGINNQALVTDGAGNTFWGEPSVSNLLGGAASQLVYQTSSTTTGFIANGTAGQTLLSTGATAPVWGALNLATAGSVTGILPAANGGTGLSAVGTAGQALISDGTNIIYGSPIQSSNLAGGLAGSVPYQSAPGVTSFSTIAAAGTVLVSDGSTPLFGKVDLSSSNAVQNVLPIANGGTGIGTIGASGTVPVSNGTSLAYAVPPSAVKATNLAGGAASQIPYQSSPDTTLFIPNGTSGQYLTSNGAAAPSWTTPAAASFHVLVTSNGTIYSKITGAGITDAAGNFYTFINNSAATITLTAPIVDQYRAYPLSVTSTSVILSPGATVGVNTISVNNEYSIDVVSPIAAAGGIILSGNYAPTAQNSVDIYSVFYLTPSANYSYTFTIPNPTNTISGRVVTITNSSSSNGFFLSIGGQSYNIGPLAVQTITFDGSKWVGLQGASQNINGGTPGAVPYQTAVGRTSFTSLGANKTVLTSNGSAPVFSNLPGAYWANLGLFSSQTLPQNSDQFINFTVNTGDPFSFWNATTKRFTPNVAGVYFVTVQAQFQNTTVVGSPQANLQINVSGSQVSIAQIEVPSIAPGTNVNCSAIVNMNGTTDYITFTAYTAASSEVLVGDAAGNFTQASIFKLN